MSSAVTGTPSRFSLATYVARVRVGLLDKNTVAPSQVAQRGEGLAGSGQQGIAQEDGAVQVENVGVVESHLDIDSICDL